MLAFLAIIISGLSVMTVVIRFVVVVWILKPAHARQKRQRERKRTVIIIQPGSALDRFMGLLPFEIRTCDSSAQNAAIPDPTTSSLPALGDPNDIGHST
jgi:hypothetical protein